MVKGERCVVTGAHGFLGTYLSQTLLSWGLEVAQLPREYLVDPVALGSWVKEANPDYIFHLAAYGNLKGQDDDHEMVATNIIKTHLLLEATKDVPYKAFINVSTSSVYGKRNEEMKETDLPRGFTMYAVTKLSGEYLCESYAKTFGKPIASIRPFTITGIGDQKIHLIPKLIESAYTGKEIPFVAKPSHDYVWVGDVITAMATLVQKIEQTKGEVYNVGSGIHYSNGAVKRIVEEATSMKCNTRENKEVERIYDNDMWVADNSKLKALGWKETQTLEEIIADMVKDYKEVSRNV